MLQKEANYSQQEQFVASIHERMDKLVKKTDGQLEQFNITMAEQQESLSNLQHSMQSMGANIQAYRRSMETAGDALNRTKNLSLHLADIMDEIIQGQG